MQSFKPGKPDPWISVGKAAKRLGVAKATVYAMAMRGELEATVVATRTFIDTTSIDRVLQARRAAPLSA